MSKSILFLLLFVCSSCGSLKISPKACQTNGIWGTSPQSSREITKEDLDEEQFIDLKNQETFLVFYDREIRMKDLLSEHNIKCEEVKKLRIEIETSWFFIRKIALKVVK